MINSSSVKITSSDVVTMRTSGDVVILITSSDAVTLFLLVVMQ